MRAGGSQIAVALSALFVASGCKEESKPIGATPPASASAARVEPVVSTADKTDNTATAAPTASAEPPFVFKASARPALREWCDAQGISSGDGPHYVAVVREWVSIACPADTSMGHRSGVRSKGMMVNTEDPLTSGFQPSYTVFTGQVKPGQSISVECDYMLADNEGYEHRTVRKHEVVWETGERPSGRTYNGRHFVTTLGDACTSGSGEMCDFRTHCLEFADMADRNAASAKEAEKERLAALASAAAQPIPGASAPASSGSAAATGSSKSGGVGGLVQQNPTPSGVSLEGAVEPDALVSEAPTEAEWTNAQEASVPGSTASGCETKAMNGWFRMRCKAGGGYVGATLDKGRRATQTKLTIEGGVLTLMTPYVQGTELRMVMARPGQNYLVELRWAPGPRPQEIAHITAK